MPTGWNKLVVLIFLGCSVGLMGCVSHKDEIANRLLNSLDSLEKKIMIQKENDPTTPLADFIPRLNQMKQHLLSLETSTLGYESLSYEYVQEMIEEVGVISDVSETLMANELSSDVGFESGSYLLRKEGRIVIDGLLRESSLSDGKEGGEGFSEMIHFYKSKYPQGKLRVMIKVVGYADGVRPGDSLKRKLSKYVELFGCNRGDAGYNRALSHLRAKNVGDYMYKKTLEKYGDTKIEIDRPKVEGKGEEFPYNEDAQNPPYKVEDERRRICKIYINIKPEKYNSQIAR